MAKTIENKIGNILFGISLAGLSIFVPIHSYASQQFDYEKEKLISSERVMTEQKTKAKLIKYNSQNKAVFSANVGTQKEPNYEIVTSDANGENQKVWTHHPFMDRFPVWASDKEIAFERIGKDGKNDVQAYYIINTETGKFKLIKQEEYSRLRDKGEQVK